MPLFSGYYYSIIFIRGFHKKATALYICDALRDLVALAQFKKRKKHRWKSATLKITLLNGCFSRF